MVIANKNNTASIGFEQQIWEAADILNELDKRRLGNVVDLFTNIKMIEHGTDKDILGRTYEYCLARFAEREGKRAGEFYTPSCVVRTLVEVLQPFKGRVYDPCCGSGGMFVQSADFIDNHSGNRLDISIFGQDSNPTTRKMALMNLAIRGIEADLGSADEIARQDYILTPGRYVGIEEQEDDGEPFEEKMVRLSGELSEMFKKSHKLEEEIRKRLGAIGYEI